MKVAEHENYLLELSRLDEKEGVFHAWLSIPVRCIVSYGTATTEQEAIESALRDEGGKDVSAAIKDTLRRSALSYLRFRPYRD